MDIKELMVGDFVSYTDEDGVTEAYIVVGTTDQKEVFIGNPEDPDDYFDVWSEKTERVKPIEISDRFLLANGFVRSENNYEHDVFVWHGDPDELGHSCSGIRIGLWDIGTLVHAERWFPKYPKSVHLPDTPYIHQLQQACRMCNINIDWKL